MKSALLSMAFAITLCAVGAHRSHAALVVTNGNFQDLSGLTALGGVWYGGVPTGWTGENANYTVRELDPAPSGNYAANLDTLTVTTGTFIPLYQAIGTLPSQAIVSVSFEVIPLIAPTSMSAGIFNTNSSASYNDWTALALPPSGYTTAGFYTLATAAPISAGTPIGIAFWKGGGSGGAPAVDNVTVVPEPSSAMLIVACIAGMGGFAAVRRRR